MKYDIDKIKNQINCNKSKPKLYIIYVYFYSMYTIHSAEYNGAQIPLSTLKIVNYIFKCPYENNSSFTEKEKLILLVDKVLVCSGITTIAYFSW